MTQMWKEGHSLLFSDGKNAGCKTLGGEAHIWGEKKDISRKIWKGG